MSVENGKVCCNCRHCIRSRDEKYGTVMCICDVFNMYMTYAEVMDRWCRHWAKERDE